MSKNADDDDERSREVLVAELAADEDPAADDCTCSPTGGNVMVVTDLLAD